jgi:hypothetical protein
LDYKLRKPKIASIATLNLRWLLLKEWKCVLVGHHDSVGKTVEEWEKAGWRLHTYCCAGNASMALGTNHYLLFEKGE